MCLKCHPLFTVERREKKSKFYLACTHTRTYQFIGDNIHVWLPPPLAPQQQKSQKRLRKWKRLRRVWDGIWCWRGYWLSENWGCKKMEIMKILRKGDLEEMSFGNLRRVHHAMPSLKLRTPILNPSPSSLFIERRVCVWVLGRIQCWRAINQFTW